MSTMICTLSRSISPPDPARRGQEGIPWATTQRSEAAGRSRPPDAEVVYTPDSQVVHTPGDGVVYMGRLWVVQSAATADTGGRPGGADEERPQAAGGEDRGSRRGA